VPGGLNLLLLLPVLDGLGIDELLQLLLLGDQQMVLVGSSLGGHLLKPILIKRSKRNESDGENVNGHRVVTGSNILSINGCDWEGCRALCNLGLLPVLSLLRGGVEDGGNGGSVHNWDGEVRWGSCSTEWVVGALGSAQT